MKYFLVAMLGICGAQNLRFGSKATNNTSCLGMINITDTLSCFYTTTGLLFHGQDPGTATLPPPYNNERLPQPLPIEGTLSDFTLVAHEVNPILYQDLGQHVLFNEPILIFPNAGDTAFQCIYAQDRGDPTGKPSCTDNMPPLISPDSDPIKTAQQFANMYTTPGSPSYCSQKGIASLGYWEQSGLYNFIDTYKNTSELLQGGANPMLAANGFGPPPSYIPNPCPGSNKHLQFQENQANAMFKNSSALAIGYLETVNVAGQRCNAFDHTSSTSSSKTRANAVILQNYLKSIGSPMANLPLVRLVRTAKPAYKPIPADALKPCGLQYSVVYGDIDFLPDQPPVPGTCDEEFCWTHPGAPCTSTSSSCTYCNKRGCHK